MKMKQGNTEFKHLKNSLHISLSVPAQNRKNSNLG
jgi:hypothetical protein